MPGRPGRLVTRPLSLVVLPILALVPLLAARAFVSCLSASNDSDLPAGRAVAWLGGPAGDSSPAKLAAACGEHLRTLGGALEAYRRDHGAYPSHLTDLYPHYVADRSVFFCPADEPLSSPGGAVPSAPPRSDTSYVYDLGTDRAPVRMHLLGPNPLPAGATWRQVRMAQRPFFGDRVPILRCYHHDTGALDGRRPMLLNLTLSGQVYASQPVWETDPETVPVVVTALERDLTGGPGRYLRRWGLTAMAAYFAQVGRVEAGALPPALRRRLSAAAERLCTLRPLPSTVRRGDLCDAAGSLLWAAGDTARAEALYRQALQLPGDGDAAAFRLAELYDRAGATGRGRAVLSAQAQAPGSHLLVVERLVALDLRSSRPDQAVCFVKRLLGREPQNIQYADLLTRTRDATESREPGISPALAEREAKPGFGAFFGRRPWVLLPQGGRTSEETQSNRPRLHADRAAGRDRHHRHSGGHSVPRVRASA